MFFGALDPRADPSSRAAACGHLTTHGDGFIRNSAYEFTYEVVSIAAAGAPPSYALRLRNESTDRTFVLTYREDAASAGYGAMALDEAGGKPGILRHSAFTTF